MSTVSKTSKSRKPERRIRVLHPLSDSGAAVIAITVDGKEDVYAVRLIAADFGAAFHVIKGELVEEPDEQTLRLRTAAEYDVLLHGSESSCTCPGHNYRGRCRHVDGLTALRQRNLL